MKMSCSQLATPLTPVQAVCRTNGNARECATLWWLHSARKEGRLEEGEKPVAMRAACC